MARPLRLEFAGALYHITSRGDRREDIYTTDADRQAWLGVLAQVCQRFGWRVYAYCLMSNHYHLLVQTPEANLARGMRQLNGVYTQWVNRAHGRVGHVFQGRYKAIVVEQDSYLLELVRYVVLNPVRVAMVAQPGEWPWSSYQASAGLAPAPGFLSVAALLKYFDQDPHTARQRYVTHVLAGVGKESPWAQLRQQIYLGGEEFIKRMNRRAKGAEAVQTPEIPLSQRQAPLTLEQYSAKHKTRDGAIAAAFASGHYTQAQIAQHFGLHYTSISRIVKGAEAAPGLQRGP